MNSFSSMSQVFSNKCETGGKHYLIAQPYKSWEAGSVFRVMGNIIYDCDTKAYEIYYGGTLPGWTEVSDSEARELLLSARTERMSLNNATNKIDNKGDVSNILKSECTPSSYLLSEAHLEWQSGSIFDVTDNTIYDCDKKNTGTIESAIPTSWLPLTVEEKKFLITKKKKERVTIFRNNFNTNVSTSPSESTSGDQLSPKKIKKKEVPPKSVCSASIPLSNTYFEQTLILPHALANIKDIHFDEWNLGEKVCFRLAESYAQYEGLLRWSGSLDNINAAVVELDLSKPDDLILKYQCSLDFCSKLFLSLSKPAVLVLLSTIKTISFNQKLMGKYFPKLLGSVNDVSLVADIFKESLKSGDRMFTMSLIQCCPPQFLYDLCFQLIAELLKEPNRDILLELISKMKTSQSVVLLKIAKACLIKKKDDIYKAILQKCQNKNGFLESGETFLTDIIKSNAPESVIITAIKMKHFDVNKANKKNETPLTLACGRILTASVRLLVDSNCRVDHDNYRAMDILFAAKQKAVNMDQLKNVIDIIELLNTKPKVESNICSICMDRKINTAFDCGHTCCQECSSRLTNCPSCSRKISSKISLYLD